MIKIILFRIKCVFFLPFWILLNLSAKRDIVLRELAIWGDKLPGKKQPFLCLDFIRMMAAYPEFRSLVAFRCGGLFVLSLPLNSLHLETKSERVGEGLFIWHGFSTIVFAESIGENCNIWHNVTIGRAHDYGSRPRIGHNVNICTGAVVIGDIVIGDNVTIGAGAIVVKDVPSNCTVVGNPARIIKKTIN